MIRKSLSISVILILILSSITSTVAFADVTATVGSTEAKAQFSKETNDDSTFTVKSDSAKTKADALSNAQGETEGSVDAPGSDTASSATPKEINSGKNSTVSVDSYNTGAKTEDITISTENTEEQSIEATEDVKNVQVKATGDVKINDEKLDTILSAGESEGHSIIREDWVKDGEGENKYAHIIAETKHEITDVCIFKVKNNCIIEFKSGYTIANTTKLVNVDNAYKSTATAKIEGFKIWDPSISNYVEFGDLENSSDSVKDYTETLKAMNKILALSDIEITVFLYVRASTGDNMSSAEAKLLQAILKDASGNPLITVDIADVRSKINDFNAETSGEEIKINDATTTPTPAELIIKGKPEQPVVNEVPAKTQGDPVLAPVASENVFPATGLNEHNRSLWYLLLALSTILGSFLLHDRKKVTR